MFVSLCRQASIWVRLGNRDLVGYGVLCQRLFSAWVAKERRCVVAFLYLQIVILEYMVTYIYIHYVYPRDLDLTCQGWVHPGRRHRYGDQKKRQEVSTPTGYPRYWSIDNGTLHLSIVYGHAGHPASSRNWWRPSMWCT